MIDGQVGGAMRRATIARGSYRRRWLTHLCRLATDSDYPDPDRASAWLAQGRESLMKVGYVVLYVDDAAACRRFWVEQVGMVEKRHDVVGEFTIARVGFADQPFAFELVPLDMMRDNPDALDLATPSICFNVDDLEATRAALVERGVQATEVGEHQGTPSFAFSDPEGRWFAVTR